MSIQDHESLLKQLAREFRRYKEENKEKAGAGSQQRRHHTAVLDELAGAFEAVLDHWVPDGTEREAWRAHFHHFEPPPGGPEFREPPLFRGRTNTGGWAEIRQAPGPAYELLIDGKPVRRLSESPRLGERPISSIHFDGQVLEESFDAPPAALASLAGYYDGSRTDVPWEHAPELYAAGLVDANFGLTDRGQRWLEQRHHPAGGAEVWL